MAIRSERTDPSFVLDLKTSGVLGRIAIAVVGGLVLGLASGVVASGGIGLGLIAGVLGTILIFAAVTVEARRGWGRAETALRSCQDLEVSIRQEQRERSRARVRALASAVSSRLNNALMVILGSLDMAERRSTDALQRLEFEAIRSGVVDANRICRRLSQLASEGRSHRAEPVDVIEALQRSVPTIRARAGGAVRLRVTTDADALPVEVSAESINGLLQRAVDTHLASISHGGTLSIRVREAMSSPQVVLDIESSGAVPLVQDDVLHASVASLAGTAIHESFLEEGVRRTRFRLPLLRAKASPWKQSAETGSWRMPLERDVLVVDDDPNVRPVIVGMLESNGCAVRAVASGDEANGVLETHSQSIGLAIVDLVLPGESGLDLAEALRARYPEIPVLMVTGAASQNVPDALAIDPAVVLLNKPFMQPQLEAAIERLVPLADLSAVAVG